MKQKRLVALLLVLAMLFAVVTVIAACDKHECKHVCETCGKCTDATCTDPACKDKCPGHETAHVCGHVCPTCGKCTDNTCTDPVCADKCQGHVADGEFTPITQPVAGQYYMGMKCSGDTYYYLKGGMNGYYMATSSNKEDAVIVDLIADGDGWLLKQGNQYMEIENSNGHINAVYKATRTAGKHWSWDETYNIFTWENGTYFYGTYGSFNTIGGGNYATHAASNYKAQLGTFGNQQVVQPDPESVTLNKSGTLYLAPQSGNYIQLNATVQPVAASQDVEWSSSNEQAATVQNGKVTYVGAGQTTITATAKDTAIKTEVTIVVTDKGSREQPLSVVEAIALMDTAGDGVTLGDSNNKFYITGKVEEGSIYSQTWTVNLLGTGDKKLQCSFEHDNSVAKLVGYGNGKLDNCTLVLKVSLKKDSGTYTVVDASVDSGTLPDVTAIVIDETAEVKMPLHAKLEVKEILPTNARLDGTEQWHSSDESKATVDNNGEVTGVAAGNVQIWVSVGEIESNKCNVTITAQESSSKFVYDWTGKLTADTVCDSTLYDYGGAEEGQDMLGDLNKWTPGQTEIKSCILTNGKFSNTGMGFGHMPGRSKKDTTIALTTEHQIKKITFKIIPLAEATTTQISVNGKSFTKDKPADAVYNGKLDSAFDVEITLDSASTSLNIVANGDPNTNKFVIVGMTLEW